MDKTRSRQEVQEVKVVRVGFPSEIPVSQGHQDSTRKQISRVRCSKGS